MKHILFGGDGFVGRVLAAKLVAEGEKVIVADINKGDCEHYDRCEFLHIDVTDPKAVNGVDIAPQDPVYNLSAKMLSPIVTREERHDFFWPVNYHGTVHILEAMKKAGAKNLVHFTTDMIYGHTHTVPMTEEHPVQPLGEYGESKLAVEQHRGVASLEGQTTRQQLVRRATERVDIGARRRGLEPPQPNHLVLERK